MTRNGTAYRLPTWAPLTDETESGLWRTPTSEGQDAGGKDPNRSLYTQVRQWPTPKAQRGITKAAAHKEMSRTSGAAIGDLRVAVHLWPTPTAMNNTGGAALCKWGGAGARKKLRTMVTPQELNGALNPTWVEWLMGFPLGWTVLEHWVTRSSRKSSKSLAEPS